MSNYRTIDDANRLLEQLDLPLIKYGERNEVPTLLAICEKLYGEMEQLNIRIRTLEKLLKC